MKDIRSPDDVPRRGGESKEVYRIKQLLVALGLKLGFSVDVEEEPESELGNLGIRHDVIWYDRFPRWYKRLLELTLSRNDLELEYRRLLESKLRINRYLYAAFEIEGSDIMTKAMKGDISNLSKWQYGVVIVRRGRREVKEESKRRGRYVEPVRNRFERALLEFRKLHGPNNVIVVSFSDVEDLCREFGITSDASSEHN